MRRHLETVLESRRAAASCPGTGRTADRPGGDETPRPSRGPAQGRYASGAPVDSAAATALFEMVSVPIELSALPSSCDLSALVIEYTAASENDEADTSAVEPQPVLVGALGPESTDAPSSPVADGMQTDTQSAFLPDYRAAAENLLARLPRGRTSVVLFLAADDEAYSARMTAHLLGALAARLDDPVLAVDGTTTGELANYFGAQRQETLSDMMSGGVGWQEKIVQTTHPGLCFLPIDGQGQAMEAPSLAQLCDAAKSNYGLIAIDAGSFVESQVRHIAAECGGCFIVVRRDRTKKARAINVREKLASSGGKLLGSLLLSHEDPS